MCLAHLGGNSEIVREDLKGRLHLFFLLVQDEMTVNLGLSTTKALTILRDQLSALLEGHQKERKKVISWKVNVTIIVYYSLHFWDLL